MNDHALWNLTGEALVAIRSHYEQVVERFVLESGFETWGLLRGFIEGADRAPRVTEAGRAFRDQVEADTDRYFFAPWACLDNAEKAELADLLTRLRDGLRGGTP